MVGHIQAANTPPEARLASAEAEMQRLVRDARAVGISIDASVGGIHSHRHAGRLAIDRQNPVTAHSRFATVCLAKLLTSIVVLQLCDQGLIGLDAPIGEYLPEFGRVEGSKGKIILVRHLLSHTSGYRGLHVNEMLPKVAGSWDKCVEIISNAPQLFVPGSVFNEESLDQVLLARIVSNVCGCTIQEMITRQILAPLDIIPGDRVADLDEPAVCAQGHIYASDGHGLRIFPNDTSREPDDLTAGTVSFMTMTSHDLWRLADALAGPSSSSGDTPIFSAAVVDMLLSEVVRLPRTINSLNEERWRPTAFGLGAARFNNGTYGYFASGRGQSCSLVVDRKRKLSVGLGLNVSAASSRAEVLDRCLTGAVEDTSPKVASRILGRFEVSFPEFIAPFHAQQLVGGYIGSLGSGVTVMANEDGIGVFIDKNLTYIVSALQSNRVGMRARSAVPFGVFADPVFGTPCLMIGMQAYRKIR